MVMAHDVDRIEGNKNEDRFEQDREEKKKQDDGRS